MKASLTVLFLLLLTCSHAQKFQAYDYSSKRKGGEWSAIERCNYSITIRKNQVTIEATKIQKFDIVSSKEGVDKYGVTYIEHTCSDEHGNSVTITLFADDRGYYTVSIVGKDSEYAYSIRELYH